MRIVFMGTPDFAVESLKTLIKNKCNIVGVVTAPDKASGRGQKITMSAVKEFALANNLLVLQPEKLKSPEFIAELKALKADLQVVVAFRMLPEIVWNMPAKGTINLHGSLLPQYRGAAPIHWAVINGEKETGVTTFFLQHQIDTGKIILQEKIAIGENDTTGTIYNRLMVVGAKLLFKTVEQIKIGSYKEIPQSNLFESENDLKHAPKLFKEDCEINWNHSANTIHNFVRGLNPYPTAWTTIVNETEKISCKIHNTLIYKDEELPLPTINNKQLSTDNKNYIKVNCTENSLLITELQLAGKKRMLVKDFLVGYKLSSDTFFE